MTQRAVARTSSPLGAFNPQRALSLCNDDPDLARDLSALFLTTASELVAKLQAAAAAGDSREIQGVAHTLKGAAANLGGERLEALAKVLMKLGREGELAAASARMGQLHDELRQLEAALAQFRSDLDSRAA